MNKSKHSAYTMMLMVVSLAIAACAAYFSVSGIASLFAGNKLEVAIMASALELGKLVAASFLYRYWLKTPGILKTYLLIGTFVLMIVTSAGIGGYLSSAYETTAVEFGKHNTELVALEQREKFIIDNIDRLETQRASIESIRNEQSTRLADMYSRNQVTSARRTEAAMRDLNDKIDEFNVQVNVQQDSLTSIRENIVNLKLNNTQSAEMGSLLYLARTFNVEMDTVVKFFIFILIFVFDPMAVALLIAYNVAVGKKMEEPVEESPNTTDNNTKEAVEEKQTSNKLKKKRTRKKLRSKLVAQPKSEEEVEKEEEEEEVEMNVYGEYEDSIEEDDIKSLTDFYMNQPVERKEDKKKEIKKPNP